VSSKPSSCRDVLSLTTTGAKVVTVAGAGRSRFFHAHTLPMLSPSRIANARRLRPLASQLSRIARHFFSASPDLVRDIDTNGTAHHDALARVRFTGRLLGDGAQERVGVVGRDRIRSVSRQSGREHRTILLRIARFTLAVPPGRRSRISRCYSPRATASAPCIRP
jgi:hypothetical protein